MEKIENFSDYKKRQRENEKKSNLNENKYFNKILFILILFCIYFIFL